MATLVRPSKTHSIRPSLPIRLISLDTVENGQRSPLSPSRQADGVNHQLQLVPGRCSELLICIENTSSEPLRWHLEVGGLFPSGWCQWSQEEPVIEARSKLSQLIAFEPPADFFEQPDALVAQPNLQLAYEANVSIFAQLEDPLKEASDRTSSERIQSPTSPGEPESEHSNLSSQATYSSLNTLVGYQTVDLTLHPGNSYLDFLPEIYRSDFMARFIAIFEQAFDPTVQTTDSLWAYLDPLTAPKSLIPFLAQWVDWPLNPNWTLKRQRKLIKHAVELYQWRGTRQGLVLMLHLHTGLPLEASSVGGQPAIEIKESFETGFVIGQANLGNQPRLGGGKPYFFAVTLRPQTLAEAQEIDEPLVRQVIEQEKPAFCSYELDIVWPENK